MAIPRTPSAVVSISPVCTPIRTCRLEPLYRVPDGASALDRPCGAFEGEEEPVACRVDLAPAESIDLASDDPVVISECLAPASIPEACRGRCRVHDVRHQHRHDLPRQGRRQAELRAVAGQVDEIGRLVADHPRVVAWWDIEDVTGDELVDLVRVGESHREAAADDELQMVYLTPFRADDRLDILGPTPARLEDRPADRQSADLRSGADATSERTLIGGIEQAGVFESGHASGFTVARSRWRRARTLR